ncbi:MAG TPA: hypothetical protein DCQ80_12445 [Pseudomonas sp.]|nr:hypothetical protein [Pseudomonas sp.]
MITGPTRGLGWPGSRKAAGGGWRLEAGGWRLEAGGWRLDKVRPNANLRQALSSSLQRFYRL